MSSSVRVGRAFLPDSIVITGLGLVHGLGIGIDPLLEAVSDDGSVGRASPLRAALRGYEGQALPDEPAVECSDFEPENYRESSKTYLDRCSDLTLGACYLAVRDAGLSWQEQQHPRWGVSLGSAHGCLESMLNMTGRVQQKGLRFGSPVIFTHSFANSPAALAAIEYDLQGPCMTHCVGDLSGAVALEYALTAIRLGKADLVLAGGADALSRALLASVNAGTLGAKPGEAGALLVTETAEHAKHRGAQPLAELAGAAVLAQTSDGDALTAALEDAGEEAAEVVTAPAACGHTFGASVALDAATCVGLLADEHQGPLAAVSRDRRAALVFRRWGER